MTDLILTDEEVAIINALPNHNTIKVNAFAGTGKTTVLYELTRAYPELKFLYLVFNTENKNIAEEKFNIENAIAKTVHAFALSYVRNDLGIKGYIGNCIVNDVLKLLNLNKYNKDSRYKKCWMLLEVFKAYCHSAHMEINRQTVTEILDADKKLFIDIKTEGIKIDDIVDYLNQIWALYLDKALPATHDFYLKYFQLNIKKYNKKIEYDVIMLDECQDSNNVTLSIFENFKGKKVLVGDKNQAIYGWRKAINVMNKIDADITLNLTKTFRFGTHVSILANSILNNVFNEQNSITSFYPDKSIDCTCECRITRTNSTLIRELDSLTREGKFVKTVRNPQEIFKLALSIYNFKMGNKNEIKEPRIKYFKSMMDLEKQAKDMKDIEMLVAIKLVADYDDNLNELFDIATKNFANKEKAEIYLTTAHTSKGGEWDHVIILDDFGDLLTRMIDEKIYSINDLQKTITKNYSRIQDVVEEFNLFYVAVTRAISKLTILSKNKKYLELSTQQLNDELIAIKTARDEAEEKVLKYRNK